MAAYLSFTSQEQEGYINYEAVLAISEDSHKIRERENAVKQKLEVLNNNSKLDFDYPSEAVTFWIRGNRALEGHGESINVDKAIAYFTKAAELEFPQAYSSLGKIYEEGLGVKENKKTAFKKYSEGAKLGDAHSMFAIGQMLENQARISPTFEERADLAEPANYFKASADKGCPAAKVKLGNWIEQKIYSNADAKDPDTYYEEAAKYGNGLAFNHVGVRCYKLGEYKTAMEKFHIARDLNCADALNNLGICYENGEGVIKDKSRSIEYYEEAAKKGSIAAMINLGYLLVSCERYQEASMWFRQALIENPKATDAYLGLGELYLAGKGVEKNLEVAFRNFVKAGGNGKGFKRCGDIIWMRNRSSKESMNEAMDYYKKAIKLKCVEAMILMGQIYERGNEHIEVDKGKAIEYYENAYLQGSPYGGINQAKLLIERKTKADRENAIKILKKILNDHPNDEAIRAYIQNRGINAILKDSL